MRSFHRYLLGTMGQRILFFWIDAERFRRVTKKEHRRFAFRDIQTKYLRSGSPWELPEIMKWASLCGVSDDLGKRSSFKFPKSVINRMYLSDASIFAENVFVCGQKMAIDRLVCYWVPKFMQHKKKIRGILEEKRLRQSLKPVSEVVPEVTVTKHASQEEIDTFMEAHCVSSSESVGEKDDEIRARRLEKWKRWFWEGVDEDIPSENEKVVELPEDMPEELRQLGGIREFSSSCFVTPEQEKETVDVISEKEGDQNVSESPRETDGSPKDKMYSRSLCFPPKSLPSSPKKRSLSEPTFSTTSLVEWYQWHENIHIKLTSKTHYSHRSLVIVLRLLNRSFSLFYIIVTKHASQEEIDTFMEAHCVSSSESAGEKDDEIRARRLEEWKRWFWEGVDEDIPSENEKVVELPEDMPEELRQLGGLKIPSGKSADDGALLFGTLFFCFRSFGARFVLSSSALSPFRHRLDRARLKAKSVTYLDLITMLLFSTAIVGRDDEDNEEAEAFNDEFKIPSLKDHEKEMEVLNASKRRVSHFYPKTFKKGEDTVELAKTTAPTKMKTPKPRSFNDALFEPVHLTAFKKFLAERNAEAPIAFWQAVENMKTNCKDVKARLARAATIVRKFFINIPMSAVEYLNCKADIIRDIPTLDKVTPAMLISAQACVSRSIEENWYSQYMATFPEDEDEEENFAKYAMRNTLAGVCKLTGYGKTSTARDQKRHAPHPTRRMVNSKLVSVDRLVSDVEFWLEVERFKNLADHAAESARSGNYTLEDENLLLGKAKAIVKCFIDSDVPPRLQVRRECLSILGRLSFMYH
ncbi:PREDICTED: uncharacterized protein LOC107331568 [Acropora digitifera]|uniref:uncharacterized protein LOC107331568 n=1 Tax=Acropora digitifera TaxID=70779 RepID=UPI00077A417D|nr:PREDICTED: uncharacterized protein LOC107331568 [Acropora digitifera]